MLVLSNQFWHQEPLLVLLDLLALLLSGTETFSEVTLGKRPKHQKGPAFEIRHHLPRTDEALQGCRSPF